MEQKTKKISSEKPKKCREKGCSGLVNLNMPVLLQTGCRSCAYAYPCDKCEMLHWFYNKRVSGVRNRSGEKTFHKNGILSHKPK